MEIFYLPTMRIRSIVFGLLILLISGTLVAAPESSNSKEKESADNTLGLQLQFWTGTNGDFYQSDLEGRFFRDDLLRGQNSATQPVAAAQWNNHWVNKPQFNLPIRAYFAPSFLPQLYVDAAYYRIRGSISYYGVSDLPLPERTHIIELSGYDRSSTTVGLAYNFLGYFRKDAAALLALRGGFVRESLNFNYKPLSFAQSGIGLDLFVNPYRAHAGGLYGGVEFTWPFFKYWSATFRVDQSQSLTGKMSQERTQIQPSSTGFQATYERSQSGYKLERTDKTVALNFYVTVDFKLSVGYREVVYYVSYPGYFTYSFSSSGGTLQILPPTEVTLDYFNYQEKHKERLGNSMLTLEKIFYF